MRASRAWAVRVTGKERAEREGPRIVELAAHGGHAGLVHGRQPVIPTPPTAVVVDPTGKQAGRGAYMHSQRVCWERAMQGQKIARALRM